MKTWLKLIGSAEMPITGSPYFGHYNENHVGFRKANKPSIQRGDHLFLYAPGGSKRIFALAEAVSDPEADSNYDSHAEGSCHWKLNVRYVINLPVRSGIQIDAVTTGHRNLTDSIRQQSHIKLTSEESKLAFNKLKEKKESMVS